MAIQNLPKWALELLQAGEIVQDGDTSVSRDEAERRFNRYVELVAMVEGDEGPDAVRALLRSIQARYSYGAYEATMGAVLGKFPMEVMVPALLSELPDLIHRQSEWAGDIINQVAHRGVTPPMGVVELFNSAVAELSLHHRQAIEQFVRQEEDGGWLAGRQGILCPKE